MKYQLAHCIGSRLRRLSRIADSHLRKCLIDFDISENQMTILFAMSELGRVEQGKIGEELYLERSTVSRNIKLLEKMKLVVRSADYRPQVELTKAGKAMVQQLIPHWEKVMDDLMEQLGTTGMKPIVTLENQLR